jgi:uncharacterized damage-inducible protein DinB
MADISTREAWLRGPLPGIPPLLQPVAHALLQSREEINTFMRDFPNHLLWERPAEVASPGFHLRHLAGVLDRLLTYAREEMLKPEQLQYLRDEAIPTSSVDTTFSLLEHFNKQVDAAMKQLAETDETALTKRREVGRAKIPSTLIGLLFHAAEHTMRHTGQLLVTARVLLDRDR